MLELLKTLCALPGPSGEEDAVRAFIREQAEPHADEIRTDAMGNLMIFRAGARKPEKPMLVCAHMDEVGLIVKRITDDGMLKFGFVGGIDPRVVIGRRVKFGDTAGVVGIKAVHLTKASERRRMPDTKDLYIDIGASSKKAAQAKVSLGDYGVFDSDVVEFGDGLLKAKAIDDRVGCAVMLKLLEEKPALDTWFVFTVQEETGLRGSATAAFALDPAACLVLEGTTAADLAEAPGHKQVCALRRGPVLPFMDRSTIYDQTLLTQLRDTAVQLGLPWQLKQMTSGGTDAGRIHKIRAGVPTVGLAAPVRYIHSPVSVAAVCDMENMLVLARSFLQGLAQTTE